jgi:tetratricopeptide (TPR) repeat protein
LRLGAAQQWFWEQQELFTEGRETLEEILRMSGAGGVTVWRARAAYSAGTMAYRLNDFNSALKHELDAIRIFRELGDRRGLASALLGGAIPMQQLKRCAEATSLVEEASCIWAELGEDSARDYALNNLASIAHSEGDYSKARAILEPLVQRFRARDDTQAAAWALSALGDIAAAQKEPQLARSHYEEALELFHFLDDPSSLARVMTDLADLNRECGDHQAAAALYMQALREAAKIGRRSSIARLLGAMAECAMAQDRSKRALTLAAVAAGLWHAVGGGGDTAARQAVRRVYDRTRLSLDPAEHSRIWKGDHPLSVDEAVQYAAGETD